LVVKLKDLSEDFPDWFSLTKLDPELDQVNLAMQAQKTEGKT
jgi:hypothetical protein